MHLTLFTVFIILTPLMAVSGFLSLKLAKHIEKNEKEKKKKGTCVHVIYIL